MGENETTLTENSSNPASVCGHLDALLNDASLTHQQKVTLLKDWCYEAGRLQEAETENMAGGEADKLRAVSNALIALGVEPSVEKLAKI